jgi:hypothetical protein
MVIGCAKWLSAKPNDDSPKGRNEGNFLPYGKKDFRGKYDPFL